MVRSNRSKNKRRYPGTRSHGRGNTKKGRGSGCRGGVGRGGARKHKKTYTNKYEKGFYGVQGFVSKTGSDVGVVNLSSISRGIAGGTIGKKDDIYHFRFEGKVLGGGQLLYPAVIEALSFSKKAVDKIEQVGGEARNLEAGRQ